jgi:predicted transcriptional regulator
MTKTERLTVKVLPAHKQALERIAEREDTSSAAIMRRLIRQEAERRGVWPVSTQTLPAAQPAGGG